MDGRVITDEGRERGQSGRELRKGLTRETVRELRGWRKGSVGRLREGAGGVFPAMNSCFLQRRRLLGAGVRPPTGLLCPLLLFGGLLASSLDAPARAVSIKGQLSRSASCPLRWSAPRCDHLEGSKSKTAAGAGEGASATLKRKALYLAVIPSGSRPSSLGDCSMGFPVPNLAGCSKSKIIKRSSGRVGCDALFLYFIARIKKPTEAENRNVQCGADSLTSTSCQSWRSTAL